MFCLTRKKYTHIEEKYKRIRKKKRIGDRHTKWKTEHKLSQISVVKFHERETNQTQTTNLNIIYLLLSNISSRLDLCTVYFYFGVSNRTCECACAVGGSPLRPYVSPPRHCRQPSSLV